MTQSLWTAVVATPRDHIAGPTSVDGGERLDLGGEHHDLRSNNIIPPTRQKEVLSYTNDPKSWELRLHSWTCGPGYGMVYQQLIPDLGPLLLFSNHDRG